MAGESDAAARAGYAALFAGEAGLRVDAFDPAALVLFPEMDATADVPEISEGCWDLLGVSPASVMCASSRMIIRRKGAAAPVVVACTLIPSTTASSLARRWAQRGARRQPQPPALRALLHLGGASCSG